MIINLFDLEKKFPEKVSEKIADYYGSGARDEITLHRNKSIFSKYELLPKLLRDVSAIDTSCNILGLEIDHPILIAPMAMQSMAHSDGEIATAIASKKSNTIMTLATSSNKSIEEVSPHNDKLFFQLYFAKNRKITEDMLTKCYKENYKAIVFTADAPRLGTRERDERNYFKMPDHLSLGNFKGTSFEKYDDYEGSSMNMHSDHLFDSTLTFEIIPWIKEKSKLPVLVKGILRPDDAIKCFENGADGVIISNHGGRQLDTAVPTLKQVAPIREAVGKEKLIIVDGGIRRGTDVLKCLALGANAVQIGRPILWGLGHDGQKGVELVLNLLLNELIESMVLTGCRNLKEIDKDLVVKN
ncbi:alpha-hydroxy-acid oxidizing protein [Alphaproteobacteria bacterium]|nr:alpha-hydroxy-acid oxidizing protein [Alphaproteobacteria bacterium]